MPDVPKSPPHVHPSVIANPWQQLQRFTAARIALGRCGASLPTQPHLAFQLAHAQARDAVHLPLDGARILQDLQRGIASADRCLQLHSAATDRLEYLQRPDLGRRLNDESRQALQALTGNHFRGSGETPADAAYDLAVVISDGLSARAVLQHAAPFLAVVMPALAENAWTVGPIAVVRLGRVAVADEVACLLRARAVMHLIGERPGLSSPDSMGLYLTWAPRVGMHDAQRNCVSNIRPAGLGHDAAARKLLHLLSAMFRRRLSGVELKDESDDMTPVAGQGKRQHLQARAD
jgi:ethanolamine ammonia-lyase small subunit